MDDFSAGVGGITYKGCCKDMERAIRPDMDCKRERGGYAIHDIPHCQQHACGTL
jgi:hypothetical protein